MISSTDKVRLSNKLATLVVMTIPAATPFAIYYIYERPTVSQGFFIQIAIIVSLQLAVLLNLLTGGFKEVKIKRIDAFVLSYAAALILSSVIKGSAPLFNLRESIFPLSLIAYFFLLRSVKLDTSDLNRIFVLLLFVSLVSAVYGIVQYFGFEFLGYFEEQKRGKLNVLSFMGHPNFLAVAIVPMIYIAFILLIKKKTLINRIFSLSVTCAILICLILAGARGAWLGLIISASFLYLNIHFMPFMAGYRRYFTTIFIAGVLIVAIVVALLVIPNPLVTSKYNIVDRLTAKSEISSRFFGWCVARDMFLKNPVLGIGYGGFTAKYWDYEVEFMKPADRQVFKDIIVLLEGVPPGQVHNDFLEIAAETGLLGLVSFLLIIIETFRGGIKTVYIPGLSSSDKIAVLCLLSSVVFMIVDSMFNFTFQLPVSGVLFWFFLGTIHNLSDSYIRKSRSGALS